MKGVIVSGGQSLQLAERKTTIDWAARIAAVLDKSPKPQAAISGSMVYGDQVKRVTVRVDSKRYKNIELCHLTDVQFGAVSCQEKKLVEYRDWLLSEPNRFWLWGGDMIDAATKMSVASSYDNKFEPTAQAYHFIELMAPARHRIIGYVGGNHERRIKDFDAGSFIASWLGIPYSAGKQLIDIHYGDHKPFGVQLFHGKGAAGTKGSKAQMVHRVMQEGDSQLYLVGHLHDALLLWDWRTRRQGDSTALQKICGGMSSSFLEHWGSYAEVAGMSPTDTMMIRCILEKNGHWEVTMR